MQFHKLMLGSVLTLAIAAQAAPGGKSQDNRASGSVPSHLSSLRLAEPVLNAGIRKVDAGLQNRQGKVQVILRLSERPVSTVSAGGRAGQLQRVLSQQETLDAAIAAAGGRELGSVSRALNAVMVEVDASALATLAANPSVTAIREIGRYQLHLSETVPYIGAAAVQAGGEDGAGVSVAVFDSGIDYLHASLGGSGDPEEYANNDPDVIEPGSFPTARVVGGTDFVGSGWDGSDETPPLVPDEDPLDDGPGAGHGTHVADIIGGVNGVAPGVDLYALKVCSSVSPACSGVALIQAMDWVLDPDGDPGTEDQIDIINMSLGAPYGQAFDDDLSAAVDNATAMNVLTVASAGNSSDKPYIVGSPSAAPTALSVAQTQVPSASLQLIQAGGEQLPAVFQPWSVEPGAPIDGLVQYGDTDGDNANGCDPFNGDLTGKVVLVDRGACNFTLKVKNIGDAGGAVGIIGLVAPGDPFSGGDGGDAPITIPGYMIDQADSNFLKSQVGALAIVDPAVGLPLVGQMVGSSSRGPTLQFNALAKPEIGAPGASVSAIAGSGTDTGPFGGTSGAAPMVAGSAALVLADNPDLIPAEVRARLVNTGETDIDTDPFAGLAPIARIGGGEVRVDRAMASSVAAWVDEPDLHAALSFGFLDAHESTDLTKTVVVNNYGDSDVSYSISAGFRYPADDNGAVTPSLSQSALVVPANDSVAFDVTLSIDPTALSTWYGNSGGLGADPAWITDLEYDGYVMLDADGADNDIHLPWHLLPRKSGYPSVSTSGKGKFSVSNDGAGALQVEAYNLIATSADLPTGGRGEQNPVTDFKEIGYRTQQVPAGFCGPTASYVISFAITSWERQTHANVPNAYDLYLDFDGDEIPEANIFNSELAGDLSDGRNAVVAVDLVSGAVTIFFLTDHETNSANTVLNVCAEQVGLKAGQTNNAIQIAFGGAFDLYFQGNYTDFFGALEPGGPGVDKSPVTFQGNKSGFQTVPAGATVSGTRSGTEAALLLFRGGVPEGMESAVIE